MYVCIHIYMYVCIHIYVYVCIHIYVCMYTYICMYVYIYIYVCMYTYIYMYVCIHIYWRRKWQPTPVLLPGESHGGRSLVGYSPWGHKESDTTERLHSLTHSLTHTYIYICLSKSIKTTKIQQRCGQTIWEGNSQKKIQITNKYMKIHSI